MNKTGRFKNQKPVILAVDDNTENLDILVELLGEYDVRDVISGEAALEVVAEESIDLILLDIMMPGMDGYAVCEQLKKDALTCDIPVIFITANHDDSSIEKAYEVGGADYITKPFRPSELLARVKAQLEIYRLFNELTYLAYYDSLTGIYNRRRFFELGKKLFSESENLAVVMFDIDNFKSINDTYGHAEGDEIIKMVTRVVSAAVPEGVVFGRLGGEEFALICGEYSLEGAGTWVEFIRKQIESFKYQVGTEEVGCTVSGGLSSKHSGTTTLDELLSEADKALYEAKKQGKNRTVFRVKEKRKST